MVKEHCLFHEEHILSIEGFNGIACFCTTEKMYGGSQFYLIS